MKRLSRLVLSAKPSCPWVLLIVALLFPANAFGLLIDVVSQEYSISGEGYVYNYYTQERYEYISYNETAASPLSKSITGAYTYSGGTGGYDLTTSCSGAWSSTSASVEVSIAAADEGDAFSVGGASATITFRPLVTSMLVNPYFSEPGTNLVNLTDLTSNQTLLTINSWGYNQPYLFSFNNSHLYAMSVVAQGINWASVDMYLTLQPTPIQTVPEPSTMLLLGIGLSGLACGRRIRLFKCS